MKGDTRKTEIMNHNNAEQTTPYMIPGQGETTPVLVKTTTNTTQKPAPTTIIRTTRRRTTTEPPTEPPAGMSHKSFITCLPKSIFCRCCAFE